MPVTLGPLTLRADAVAIAALAVAAASCWGIWSRDASSESGGSKRDRVSSTALSDV